MRKDFTATAVIFKAFCDPNRLAILDLLAGGEKCACVLLADLGIAQSTLSHHMKVLCDSGIVRCRVEGKWSHYSLSDEGIERAARVVAEYRERAEAAGRDAADCGTEPAAGRDAATRREASACSCR